MKPFSALCYALLVLVAALSASQATAQESSYAKKTVTLIVPFAPGGSVDLVGRLFADHLSRTLKQTVVVENKLGAGGIIGSNQVAKAAPDGYTLLLAIASTHAIQPAYKTDLPYDVIKDFAPISQFALGGIGIAVRADSPYKNIPDLIAAAKSGQHLTYGTGGNGSGGHLAAEALKELAGGIKFTHVPYKGGAPAVTDLIGGQITAVFTDTTTLKSLSASGKIRVIATIGAKRSRAFPDLPTLAEQGVPLSTGSWMALFAPANTPAAIIRQLNAAAISFISAPEITSKFDELGLTPNKGTPEELRNAQVQEIALWKRIISKAGIQID
ncbi:MAG: putative exported protein [Proteobacteria bacterium]|nr:putative exported protein [Pseudomonadota bacterium]